VHAIRECDIAAGTYMVWCTNLGVATKALGKEGDVRRCLDRPVRAGAKKNPYSQAGKPGCLEAQKITRRSRQKTKRRRQKETVIKSVKENIGLKGEK